MIRIAPLILLTCLLGGCFENSTPDPVKSPIPNERKGEWESSGVDPLGDPDIGITPTVVLNESEPNFTGLVCASPAALKDLNLLNSLNNYNELFKLNPTFIINKSLNLNEVSENLDIENDTLNTLITKILSTSNKNRDEVLGAINTNKNRIFITPEQIITEPEVDADLSIQNLNQSSDQCESINFSLRQDISPLNLNIAYESNVSAFIFNQLSKFDKVYLMLSESLHLAILNGDIFISHAEVDELVTLILKGEES